MALTAFQRDVLRLLADRRRLGGEFSVAGGVALNELLAASRRSHDVDLFHDTESALAASWDADRRALGDAGLEVQVVRERATFVEAQVARGAERVLVEWSHDSAFRFFPLVSHDVLGLTLHPLDLATNKVLALVGRREPRDWVDALTCHASVQPLGFLAWAASGKDPGLSPVSILNEAARSSRYTQLELDALDFDGPRPQAAELATRWHEALRDGRATVAQLPVDRAGCCVLEADGAPTRRSSGEVAPGTPGLLFHPGRIRGAFPVIRR